MRVETRARIPHTVGAFSALNSSGSDDDARPLLMLHCRRRVSTSKRGGTGNGSFVQWRATAEPLRRSRRRRNHHAPSYSPPITWTAGSTSTPRSEELGRVDCGSPSSSRLPVPAAKKTSPHLHHGRARRRRALLLRFSPDSLHNILAMPIHCRSSTTSSSPTSTWSTSDLPYLLAFAPGRALEPLHAHGPSGARRTTSRRMITGIEEITHGTSTASTHHRSATATGRGQRVRLPNDDGICYDRDGVTIRDWRRPTPVRASAYRFDFEQPLVRLDQRRAAGRLATQFTKASTSSSPPPARPGEAPGIEDRLPQMITDDTVDAAHTVHYAIGSLTRSIGPRLRRSSPSASTICTR